MKSLVVAAAMVFSLSGAVALLAQDNPREKVETAVPEMIRLLEKKEYKTFIEQFAPPEVYKQIIGDQKIEEFAKAFDKELGPNLLKALQSLKDVKPTLAEDGKTATFELK